MKKAIKLHKGHVRLKRPLPWDVYDGSDHLLLSRGYVIDDEAQLESLLERGMYVDMAEIEASMEKARPFEHYDPFWVWEDLTAKLGFHLTHAGNPGIFAHRTEELAGMLQALVQRSPDAVIAIIMLTMDHRRYPTVHCLQVGGLCEMLAKRLGWGKEERLSLLCAALTMNIGMHDLQQILASQREPLTPEQQRGIREHPEQGVALLRQSGVESDDWLTTVEAHHETPRGTGYPHGITGVGEHTVLLRILDIFCAKISPRMYRKPMSGMQAERSLYSDAELAAGNPFIPALIKELGLYPPGSFVKLANGEIAIVLRRSADIKTPLVLSLINGKGDPLIEPIRRDTRRDGCSVSNEIPRSSVLLGIDPSKFWQEKGPVFDRRQWA